jgi:hypothetical protein
MPGVKLTYDELKDIAAAGMTPDDARKLAFDGFSAEQILDLAQAMPKGGSGGGGGLSKQDLQDIVTGASKAAAEAGSEGMRRVLHPQNAQHPHVSAFSYPEGNIAHPKPTLLRETYFCGSRCREDQLTPREIDLLNAITGSMSAREGRWTADITGVGKNEQLHIVVPCKSIDDRMNLPSLELICVELAQGQAAVDPLSLAERVRALEAQLKAGNAHADLVTG